MTGIDLLFQLFALLLGLSIAEMLVGLGRSWRIRSGATKAATKIRIGYLVPLLGLLVLCDQTHFWVSAYGMRDHLTFSYWTLLVILAIVGGYFILSTFVFPDEPADWPDFDDYYLATNRTVVGGMFFVNFLTLLHLAYLSMHGLDVTTLPFAQSWPSLAAVFLYFPGLVALWYVKSPRANAALLTFMIALLVIAALGAEL
ncbi:hypothetical protein [Sphingomonas alba]|uniref:Uncharacterized protein n=1 Tax=Sphingomonas alba TaxID=2908208 RepID=A0ABT0RP05_9SPHN|nr:hypothetical protein [Sphingomonas alba]MCL6684298.1 hypothetical protein [Sphingomonas alba]